MSKAPAYMSGDLSSSQIEVLKEMMITVNKKRDQYFTVTAKNCYNDWSFFDMLYVALADQVSEYERMITDRAEYEKLLKGV